MSRVSSAESGDSEIELVSEEPSPRAPNTGYMSFSKSPSTTSSTTVPSTVPAPSTTLAFAPSPAMQYSILREEREAELDSELALESCGEESPKRLTHDSTKSFKESPQPVKKPTTPTSATKEPVVTPTAPSPTVLAPTSAPKEKTSTMEEKPKPSSTTPSLGLPELKVEHPAGEVHQRERRRSSQARRGSERTTAPPVVFQGLTREKGKSMFPSNFTSKHKFLWSLSWVIPFPEISFFRTFKKNLKKMKMMSLITRSHVTLTCKTFGTQIKIFFMKSESSLTRHQHNYHIQGPER